MIVLRRPKAQRLQVVLGNRQANDFLLPYVQTRARCEPQKIILNVTLHIDLQAFMKPECYFFRIGKR